MIIWIIYFMPTARTVDPVCGTKCQHVPCRICQLPEAHGPKWNQDKISIFQHVEVKASPVKPWCWKHGDSLTKVWNLQTAMVEAHRKLQIEEFPVMRIWDSPRPMATTSLPWLAVLPVWNYLCFIYSLPALVFIRLQYSRSRFSLIWTYI